MEMSLPSKRILAAAAIIVVGLVGWLLLAGSSSARDGKYTFYYVEYKGVRVYAQDYEELADGYFKIKGKKAVFNCMDYHIECKISCNKIWSSKIPTIPLMPNTVPLIKQSL